MTVECGERVSLPMRERSGTGCAPPHDIFRYFKCTLLFTAASFCQNAKGTSSHNKLCGRPPQYAPPTAS